MLRLLRISSLLTSTVKTSTAYDLLQKQILHCRPEIYITSKRANNDEQNSEPRNCFHIFVFATTLRAFHSELWGAFCLVSFRPGQSEVRYANPCEDHSPATPY